jgi:hypothetical protein
LLAVRNDELAVGNNELVVGDGGVAPFGQCRKGEGAGRRGRSVGDSEVALFGRCRGRDSHAGDEARAEGLGEVTRMSPEGRGTRAEACS